MTDKAQEIGLLTLPLTLLVVGVAGTYLISKFVDKYLSVDVDEAIIRRIEELNQARPKRFLQYCMKWKLKKGLEC